MRIATIRLMTWHPRLGLAVVAVVLLSSFSGLLHPVMVYLQPVPATYDASLQVKLPAGIWRKDLACKDTQAVPLMLESASGKSGEPELSGKTFLLTEDRNGREILLAAQTAHEMNRPKP